MNPKFKLKFSICYYDDIYHSTLLQNNSGNKRIKLGGSKDEHGGLKSEAEASSAADKSAEQITKPSEPPMQDYIHVRARRGQATDSHSLAERVIHFYYIFYRHS